MTTAADASLCPIEIRTPDGGQRPDKARRNAFGRQRHQRSAGAGEFAQFLQIARTGLRDPIGPVNARTPRTDERPFQVQTEDAVAAADRASRRDGGPHLLARIGDQGRQARRRAKATVRPGNGAHAVGRRLIVEENAAAAVDLQIDEARGQEGAGRQPRLRPVGRNLAPGPKSDDAAVPNQHRGFGMPAVTVKNTVRQDGMAVRLLKDCFDPGSSMSMAGWIGGATNPI